MTRWSVWGALLGLLVLVPQPAWGAEARKVALVIANADYANAGPLTNPANDGRVVADAARRAGFESVKVAANLDISSFRRTLRDFRAEASGADVAMIYYAGHGIEGAGKNWLIPVDAGLASNLDLAYEAIDLDLVMEAISGAKIRMVVLDACRNNPFGRSWRSATRSVTRGLGTVDVDDVLVIYAAAPGQTAKDGDGANSPFAASFAQRLVQPDLPIQLLGGLVRDDVLQSTGGEQRPFVSASITGTPVYLVTAGAKPAGGPPAQIAMTTKLPPRRPAATGARNTFGPGDWVLGRREDGFWYPGVVQSGGKDGVTILFDDGARTSAAADSVRLYDWKTGTALMCQWSKDRKWYPAKLTETSEGDAIAILFDDGVSERSRTGLCRSS